jgi:hypothetical protein
VTRLAAARFVATGIVATRLAAARLVAFDDLVLAVGLGPLDDGLARAGLRRLDAARAAATAAAAAAASRRLRAFHRGLGDWIHVVTLFLGEPGIVTRHVALRPFRAVLRRAGVGCGFAW